MNINQLIFTVNILYCIFVATNAITSLVVTLDEAKPSILDRFRRQAPIENPKLYDLKIETNVINRFAKTLVTGKIRNSGEIAISNILPASAYITGFVLETGGKSYEAQIKSREEAKAIFSDATHVNKPAGLVEANIRDSNNFTVFVNVAEDTREAVFKLAYDQLLQRQNGQYEIITNLYPAEILENLDVSIKIRESNNLRFVRALPFRSGLLIEDSKDDNKFVEVDKSMRQAAIVRFSANERVQEEIANTLKNSGRKFACQLVVQYDVERQCNGGDVLLKDDFFMHFFAPCNLTDLPKEIIFVLDKSGSMEGTKLAQLKQAMGTILEQLHANDYFTIVKFSGTSEIWAAENLRAKDNSPIAAALANQNNIQKAENYVNNFVATWDGTDVKDALEHGLSVGKQFQDNAKIEGHEPVIIFLTDGDPTVGEVDTEKIITAIDSMNNGSPKIPIFCISFGNDAKRDFLRKLCSRNNGFLRHIYADTDATKQLVNFYQEIAPLSLLDVRFNYEDSKEVTKQNFPLFFDGYELVVSGKKEGDNFKIPTVTAKGPQGLVTLVPEMGHSLKSLEKNWAYLSVKQILEASNVAKDKKKFEEAALKLAKKYKFVTPVSSMVVETPSGNEVFDTDKASDAGTSLGFSPVEVDIDVDEIIKNNDGFYSEYFHDSESSAAISSFSYVLLLFYISLLYLKVC